MDPYSIVQIAHFQVKNHTPVYSVEVASFKTAIL